MRHNAKKFCEKPENECCQNYCSNCGSCVYLFGEYCSNCHTYASGYEDNESNKTNNLHNKIDK